jgi:flavin reductase (DIM6/NTAB) family NADH-FMN oxidoreductase RutF
MLRDQFIEGMSFVAATVNVVTTDGPAGRAGLTVSAMCSVSADPPSLLVCVNHSSASCDRIEKNKAFCVNVLKDSQIHVSDAFSGRCKNLYDDKFACAEWNTVSTGAPALEDALVVFDCRMTTSFRSGTHVIYIGEIEGIRKETGSNPLIYANRAYGIALKLDTFAPQADVEESLAEVVKIGCFSPLGAYLMPGLVREFRGKNRSCRVEVREAQRDALVSGLLGGSLDIVIMYDMAMEVKLERERIASARPYVLLPSAHPLAERDSVSLESLAREPMILLDIPPTDEYIESVFSGFGLSPNIAFASPSFEMVRGMIGHGFGYSLLMTKPANNMTYDGAGLISRPLKEDTGGRDVIVAHRGRAFLRPPALKFLEHCKSRFGAD